MSIIHRIPSVPLLLISLAWSIWLSPARADDLTGLPQNDPKELLPYCASAPATPSIPSACEVNFVPMPGWARGVLMPPLPDALKPMGKQPKPVVAAPKPAPQPLQPPSDETTTAGSNAPASTSSSGPKQPENPAMITVSPFLQWIESNPQAAATEARQQAGAYRPPIALPGSNIAPGATGASGSTSPYWLPPLIDTPGVDSSSAGSSGSTAVGGSAAIYSTPQR